MMANRVMFKQRFDQDVWDEGFRVGQERMSNMIAEKALAVPPEVPRIGLVELSDRWGIEDLNEVKALADRECVGLKSGAFRDMAWFVGHKKATSRSDYDLTAVEAYENHIQRRLLNGRIGLDLAEGKVLE